jgi:hypothetical protein
MSTDVVDIRRVLATPGGSLTGLRTPAHIQARARRDLNIGLSVEEFGETIRHN